MDDLTVMLRRVPGARCLLVLMCSLSLVGFLGVGCGDDYGSQAPADTSSTPAADNSVPDGADFTPYDSAPPEGNPDDGCMGEAEDAADAANAAGQADPEPYMSQACIDAGY